MKWKSKTVHYDLASRDTARLLGAAAALLVLLGLFTGIFSSAAMTGQIAADGHAALAAHLNALLGAFFMLGVGWSLPLLSYGETGKRRLAWAVIVPNYANWGVTVVKAVLQVSGITMTGDPANNGIFIALTVSVVLPTIFATIAWLVGFRRSA